MRWTPSEEKLEAAWAVIAEATRVQGYVPDIREIGSLLGYKSSATPMQIVAAMQERGWLTREREGRYGKLVLTREDADA